MQTIPTITPTAETNQSTHFSSPSQFKPYNHFPNVENASTFNGLLPQYETQHKSAFGTVIRPLPKKVCLTTTVQATPMKIFPAEQIYYNPVRLATVTSTTNPNYVGYGQTQVPSTQHNTSVSLADVPSPEFVKSDQNSNTMKLPTQSGEVPTKQHYMINKLNSEKSSHIPDTENQQAKNGETFVYFIIKNSTVENKLLNEIRLKRQIIQRGSCINGYRCCR